MKSEMTTLILRQPAERWRPHDMIIKFRCIEDGEEQPHLGGTLDGSVFYREKDWGKRATDLIERLIDLVKCMITTTDDYADAHAEIEVTRVHWVRQFTPGAEHCALRIEYLRPGDFIPGRLHFEARGADEPCFVTDVGQSMGANEQNGLSLLLTDIDDLVDGINKARKLKKKGKP